MRDAAKQNPLLPLCLAASLLAGCSPVKISVTAQGTTSSILLQTFQSSSISALRPDPQRRYWSSSPRLRVTGWCPRGVDVIQALDTRTSLALGAPAPCALDQSFVWSAQVPDGDYVILFQSQMRSKDAIGPSIEFRVAVSAALAAPALVTNAGVSFASATPQAYIEGTVSGLAYRVRATGGCNLRFEPWSGRFDCTADLTGGLTKTLTFSAIDYLSQESGNTSITVSYNQTNSLRLSGFSGARSNGVAQASQLGTLKIANLSVAPFAGSPGVKASQGGGLQLVRGTAQIGSR